MKEKVIDFGNEKVSVLFRKLFFPTELGMLSMSAVTTIDGIFVGPYDLSVALGAPAQFATPRFAEALSRVIAACRASGKLAFIYANTMPEARAYFAQGYQGAAIGTDTAFLVKAIQGMLQA